MMDFFFGGGAGGRERLGKKKKKKMESRDPFSGALKYILWNENQPLSMAAPGQWFEGDEFKVLAQCLTHSKYQANTH